MDAPRTRRKKMVLLRTGGGGVRKGKGLGGTKQDVCIGEIVIYQYHKELLKVIKTRKETEKETTYIFRVRLRFLSLLFLKTLINVPLSTSRRGCQ